MDESTSEAKGPDLTLGIAVEDLTDGGMLAGHVADENVLLARRGNEFFAIGATCTHYSGPLAQGIVVDDTVRCPWHHACFSLRTGEVLRAPALSPVACWSTELQDGKLFVRTKKEAAAPKAKVSKPGAQTPRSIVIIGGGAAGFAAAERLRREQYQGGIVMLSSDDAPPVDRPNLSKDYLAGSAPEDWIPLRPDSFYPEHGIELRLTTIVNGIDVAAREVVLADASKVSYERLLMPFGEGEAVQQIIGSFKSISIEGGFKISNLMGLRPKAEPVILVRAIIDRAFVPAQSGQHSSDEIIELD